MSIAHLAELEQRSFLLRIGPDGWEYGQPYDICFVITDLGDQTCSIQGLDKPLLPSHWRAAKKCLLDAGFLFAKFERRNHGDVRERILDFSLSGK